MGYNNLNDIRIRLDQFTERITSRLKDRSRFPQNLSLYSMEVIQDSNLNGEVSKFYINFVKELCAPGEDECVETVYCDADIPRLVNERISFGSSIAESKLHMNPSLLDCINDNAELEKKLRDYSREKEIIDKARSIAGRYELNQDLTEKFFRWVIDMTTKVEMEYIKKKH